MEKTNTTNTSNFDHSLRPEFTGVIANQLIDQHLSINLIGDKGTGKARLLEDLSQAHFPAIKIICVDLKNHVMSFPGLLKEISRQMDGSEPVPETLDALFQGKEPVLLCLANYDALLGNINKDDRYNVEFFNHLNAIRNRGNRLLCTTQVPHSTLPVFIAGASEGNSWVTLTGEFLPELTLKQIVAEFQRQLNPERAKELIEVPANRERLEKWVFGKPKPYTRLGFLALKLNSQTEEDRNHSLKKRLKGWEKEFKRFHKNSLLKKMHNVKSATSGAIIASGLNKLKTPYYCIVDFIRALRGK